MGNDAGNEYRSTQQGKAMGSDMHQRSDSWAKKASWSRGKRRMTGDSKYEEIEIQRV